MMRAVIAGMSAPISAQITRASSSVGRSSSRNSPRRRSVSRGSELFVSFIVFTVLEARRGEPPVQLEAEQRHFPGLAPERRRLFLTFADPRFDGAEQGAEPRLVLEVLFYGSDEPPG